MVKATYNDKEWISELLCQAFDDNKSVNYIIRQKGGRYRRMRVLMNYSFEVCWLFGEVWLSADRQACALLLFPHLQQTTWKSIWLDLQLVLNAIGVDRVRRVLRRQADIKRIQPAKKMAYLWFIGVRPDAQRNGIGSKLLSELIDHAEQKELPVYLETSVERNLAWYKRWGLTIYQQLRLDYTLFFLKKDPN